MDSLTLSNQIDSLKLHLKSMESLSVEFDSLKQMQSVERLNFKINETADIINNVNAFYDSAWTKLIIVITLIGIVVPSVIQYFQRLSAKDLYNTSEANFTKKINDEVKNLRLENEKVVSEIERKYNEKLKKIEEQHRKQQKASNGNIMYLQGRVRLSEKNYVYALQDFIYAAKLNLEGGNEQSIKTMLSFIEVAIKKIKSKSDFQTLLEDNKINWDNFIGKFCTDNNHEKYVNEIKKIKEAIERLEE